MAQTEHFLNSNATEAISWGIFDESKSSDSKSAKVKAVMKLTKAQMNLPRDFTNTY